MTGRNTPQVMGIVTRSLSMHVTAPAGSHGRPDRCNHHRRIIPAASRARTARTPALQPIRIHDAGDIGVCFGTPAGRTRAGLTVTRVAVGEANSETGSVQTRPAAIGGSSRDNTGNASKHTAATTHTKRRAEADARRMAKVT